jgi:glycosyltransferase involved in cell wall biosynthesis
MPLVTVLTAAHAGRAEFLAEAGRSLSSQELPKDWRFEWVVQEDGPAPELAGVVREFPFARYQANGESLGIGTTRNLALTRAEGELVNVHDSDDLLLPGALSVAIEVFTRYPRMHWVSAQAYDLLPDGTQKAFDPLLPPGHIEPGVVNAYLAAHGRLPFFTAGMTLRTSTVRAVGGWAANPRIEEGPMIAAITELSPGYLTPEVTWLVRQHDSRTTAHPNWKTTLFAESMAMIEQRVSAVRDLRLRMDLT